jgi:Domain of unknown function (DUF4124)
MEGIVKKLLLVVMPVFVASFAQAEIYTWTDTRGAAHYTNRMDEIPVRFRARAKSLKYGEEPQEGTSAPQRQDQAQPATPAVQPAAQNPGGNFVRQKAPGLPGGLDSEEQQKKREEWKQQKMKAREIRDSKKRE